MINVLLRTYKIWTTTIHDTMIVSLFQQLARRQQLLDQVEDKSQQLQEESVSFAQLAAKLRAKAKKGKI